MLFTYLKVSHCGFQQAKFQSISASEQTGLNMACSLNPNTGFGGAKNKIFITFGFQANEHNHRNANWLTAGGFNILGH